MIIKKIENRLKGTLTQLRDWYTVQRLSRSSHSWPCHDRKYLVVGCESSGTTPISHLLLNNGKLRFFIEGHNTWVWQAVQDIYRDRAEVSDFPRLQLFDAIKVPSFAAILERFRADFPSSKIVYVLRDPRDVLASTYKTWNVSNRDELRSVPWISSQWLGIEPEDPVTRLALRWKVFLESSLRVPEVHYVKYEDFCQDKSAYICNLAASLNLNVDNAAIRERCDQQASHTSVRDYAPAGPGAWQSGAIEESDARRIEDICGEHMRNWNYL